MMENVASRLAAAVGEPVVVDHHAGTGLTLPPLDWVAYAPLQVLSVQPRATVMFNGAGDVGPLGGERCCGPAWRALYAERVASMMVSYAASGPVVWLTQPMPRNRGHAAVLAAVNRAVRDGAELARSDRVRVVDLVPVITPGRRFRRTMRRGGRRVAIRTADGVHLAPEGARMVVARVVRALRHAHVLTPRS